MGWDESGDMGLGMREGNGDEGEAIRGIGI